MSERGNKPMAIGVLARTLLSRLEASGKNLYSEVRFKCAHCQDIGLVKKDGRYTRCKRCAVTSKQKGIFF